MANFFAEQAILYQALTTIEDQRKELNEIVDYFKKSEPGYEAMLREGEKRRKIPVEIFRGVDAFFINDNTPINSIPEKYRHDSYGICNGSRVKYAGRFIFPVKDVRGYVMGFCGWDPSSDVKYLDSKNYGYKAKRNSLYGMELLPVYYNNNLPVVLVEGLMDCLVIRSCGQQCLATLGSSINGYVETILKRFGDRLYVMPDNDNYEGTAEERTAGENFVQQVFRKLPMAKVYQTIHFNDPNDALRSDNSKQVEEFKADIQNLGNMFYDFKEIRQRFKPKWRKQQYV